MRVLLVDDDQLLLAAMVRGLGRSLAIDVASSAQSGWEQLERNQYDVLVVDAVLPDEMGCGMVARLRRMGWGLPVIVISGHGSAADAVNALASGADAFLRKPFSFDELAAVARALGRRTASSENPALTVGDCVLDLHCGAVRCIGTGLVAELTPKELSILESLARRPGGVVAKSTLVEEAWDDNHDLASRALEVHVHRIRRKLAWIGGQVRIASVIPGGYRLLAPNGP